MAYKTYPKKTTRLPRKSKPLAALRTKARKLRPAQVQPTKALTMAVSKMMNRKTETKYVSQFIQNVDSPDNQDYVREVLNSSDANTRLRSLLPNVSQGTEANQRIGNTITPVKFRVTIQYYIDESNTRGLECYVRQFMLTSKSFKNEILLADAQSDVLENMLDRGDGTFGYPAFGAAQDTWIESSLPVAKEHFSLIPRGNKTFKFAKQPGYLTNAADDSGTTPYAPNRVSTHKCVVNIKCPKLKYDNAVSSGATNYYIPTNYCPLWGACGYVITSENNAQYRQLLGTISGSGEGVPANPLIRYTIFSELWFKDD